MPALEVSEELDADGHAQRLRPRSDVVVETEAVVDPDGTHRFGLRAGPFRHYERSVRANGRGDVTERIEWSQATGPWAVLFHLPIRSALRRPPGRTPWWAPPDVLDARAASVLAALATISLAAGYLGTLLTQSLTFAADQFGADEQAQGDTLAAVRIGVLLSLAVAAAADTRGRRRTLLWATGLGCVATALGALAPGLVVLGATQTVARGMATASGLLIAVVAAEEMPAGSRAYAISLLTMSGALGAGLAIWFLPLADLGPDAWRILYVVPLAFLPLLVYAARTMPESKRFTVTDSRPERGDARLAGHYGRLTLIAGTAFLLAVFGAPASQLQNEFLRDDLGFSAARISLFTILTVTPGGLGIVVGGRLADVRGRRSVGALGVAGGTLFTMAMFLTSGWTLWAASMVGSILGALTVPALAVYGPELFPTALRGKANGVITVVGVLGSVLGLVTAGRLADPLGLGPAIAVLGAFPLVLVVVILMAYPETAGTELEDLNPQDRLGFPTPLA